MRIDNLKPGRELDALVAEKVMGWIPYPPQRLLQYPGWYLPNGEFKNIAELPRYSTDIAAAMQVLDVIWKKRGDKFSHLEISRDSCIGWYCRLAPEPGHCDPFVFAIGDTPSHAISLAALRAWEKMT